MSGSSGRSWTPDEFDEIDGTMDLGLDDRASPPPLPPRRPSVSHPTRDRFPSVSADRRGSLAASVRSAQHTPTAASRRGSAASPTLSRRGSVRTQTRERFPSLRRDSASGEVGQTAEPEPSLSRRGSMKMPTRDRSGSSAGSPRGPEVDDGVERPLIRRGSLNTFTRDSVQGSSERRKSSAGSWRWTPEPDGTSSPKQTLPKLSAAAGASGRHELGEYSFPATQADAEMPLFQNRAEESASSREEGSGTSVLYDYYRRASASATSATGYVDWTLLGIFPAEVGQAEYQPDGEHNGGGANRQRSPSPPPAAEGNVVGDVSGRPNTAPPTSPATQSLETPATSVGMRRGSMPLSTSRRSSAATPPPAVKLVLDDDENMFKGLDESEIEAFSDMALSPKSQSQSQGGAVSVTNPRRRSTMGSVNPSPRAVTFLNAKGPESTSATSPALEGSGNSESSRRSSSSGSIRPPLGPKDPAGGKGRASLSNASTPPRYPPFLPPPHPRAARPSPSTFRRRSSQAVGGLAAPGIFPPTRGMAPFQLSYYVRYYSGFNFVTQKAKASPAPAPPAKGGRRNGAPIKKVIGNRLFDFLQDHDAAAMDLLIAEHRGWSAILQALTLEEGSGEVAWDAVRITTRFKRALQELESRRRRQLEVAILLSAVEETEPGFRYIREALLMQYHRRWLEQLAPHVDASRRFLEGLDDADCIPLAQEQERDEEVLATLGRTEGSKGALLPIPPPSAERSNLSKPSGARLRQLLAAQTEPTVAGQPRDERHTLTPDEAAALVQKASRGLVAFDNVMRGDNIYRTNSKGRRLQQQW